MTDSTWGETKRKYGCVKCQKYHYEGDALFDAHLYFQSKHGIKS